MYSCSSGGGSFAFLLIYYLLACFKLGRDFDFIKTCLDYCKTILSILEISRRDNNFFCLLQVLYASGYEDSTSSESGSNANDVRRIAQFFRLLRITKTLRIIRIFKLARHSTGLQALGRVLVYFTFSFNYSSFDDN